MRKALFTFLLLSVLAALAGCGSSSSDSTDSMASATDSGASTSSASTTGGAASGGTAVDIKGFAFGPDTLMVKAGDSVTFTNDDSAPHTATADDKSFDTGTLNQGDSKAVSFDTAGTISYVCQIHPFMHGSIVVS